MGAMAAARKKKAAEGKLPSRALEHGAKAWGARFLKPGVALTPELDLALALGHGSAMGPAVLLPDLAPGKKPPAAHDRIPRNVAIGALRGGFGIGRPTTFEDNPAPIDESEARQLLVNEVPKLNLLPVHYLALEAMVGPSCVLPAFVDGVERIKAGDWDTGRLHGLWPVLYGLLLRVPEPEHTAARARLEALFEAKRQLFASARLDFLLHGPAGIARRGYKYIPKFKSFGTSDSSEHPSNVADLCFCDGAPAFVAAQFRLLWQLLGFRVIAHMSGPSPARLFFLGGDETFETELEVVQKYPGTKQGEALDAYELFRSPLAARCVLRLTDPKSKVQARALAWLRGQPHVAALLATWAKEKSPDAELAKAALG